MEISSNSINQPVNFYQKNTGNTINMAIDEDNRLISGNIFSSSYGIKETTKPISKSEKRRKRNKRLYTYDSDYLPDGSEYSADNESEKGNFFLIKEDSNIINKINKKFKKIISVTPIVNYFFLKEKTKKIKTTVDELYDISQNVDEMLSSRTAYGEEGKLYTDIADNLTNAANILGKVNRSL